MTPWIEAMRLRTLPVSVAGVVAAVAYSRLCGTVHWVPAALCLAFAVLAQIASNFANEYYDYRAGLDAPGRVGPRRGVTEGDITPRAMLVATFATLGLSCVVGLSLLLYGPWWLLLVGAGIALGVLAYSAGPWPLSHHALGEVAVLAFFGVIPVNFTFLLVTGWWTPQILLPSVAFGLMGANVLIVNNHRDRMDDASVGKRTLAVRIGSKATTTLYLFNGFIAGALLLISLPKGVLWLPVALYLILHSTLWWRLTTACGSRLNPLLGITACAMLLTALLLLVISLF